MARRKKRVATIVPVASMGDIAFLLIIFFILATNFARDSNIKLTQPASPHVDEMGRSNIMVIVDEEGRYYVDGVEQPTVQDVEAQVRSLLEIRAAQQQGGGDEAGDDDAETEVVRADDPRVVHLKIDANIEKSTFYEVFEAVTKAGGILAMVGDEGQPARK
jgi:biopolymer transport protein ExbD